MAKKRRSDPKGRYKKRVAEDKTYQNIADMLPVVGDARSLGRAKDAYQRGDYGETALELGSTALGYVPIAGPLAKAGIKGARSVARKADQIYPDVVGAARAVKDGDIDFLRGWNKPTSTQGVGADVVRGGTQAADDSRAAYMQSVRQRLKEESGPDYDVMFHSSPQRSLDADNFRYRPVNIPTKGSYGKGPGVFTHGYDQDYDKVFGDNVYAVVYDKNKPTYSGMMDDVSGISETFIPQDQVGEMVRVWGGGKPVKYNKGGDIPDLNDPTNVDSVPAMLTPGEFVLNKEAASMYGPIIEQMNNNGLKQRAAENKALMLNQGGKVDPFDSYFDKLLKHEGGWSDHAADKGGKTNLGITLNTLKSVNPDATAEDLRNLTKDQAKEIYRKNYYEGPGIDKLPAGIREQAFDIAVNSGPGRAIKMVQELAGVEQDGIIGPNTIEAASGIDNNMLADRRQQFYNSLVANDPSQEAFIKGWTNRANSFREGEKPKEVPAPQAAPPQEVPPQAAPPVQVAPQQSAAVQQQQSIPQEAPEATSPVDEGGGFFDGIGSQLGQLFAPSPYLSAPQLRPTSAGNPEFIPSVTSTSPIQPAYVEDEYGINRNKSIYGKFNQGGSVQYLRKGGAVQPGISEEEKRRKFLAQQALLNKQNNSPMNFAAAAVPAPMAAPPQRPVRPGMAAPVQAAPAPLEGNPIPFGGPAGILASKIGLMQNQAVPEEALPEFDPTPPIPGSDEAILQGSSQQVEKKEEMSYPNNMQPGAQNLRHGAQWDTPQAKPMTVPNQAPVGGAVDQSPAINEQKRLEQNAQLREAARQLPEGHPERIRLMNAISHQKGVPPTVSAQVYPNQAPAGGAVPPPEMQEVPEAPGPIRPGTEAWDAHVANQQIANQAIPQPEAPMNFAEAADINAQQMVDQPGTPGDEEGSPMNFAEAAGIEAARIQEQGGLQSASRADDAPSVDAEPAKSLGKTAPVEAMKTVATAMDEHGEPPSEELTAMPKPEVMEKAKELITKDPSMGEMAKSSLKKAFGDMFDPTELGRMGILFLGALATGASPGQALAYAGQNYLARVDAKTNEFKKLSMSGKYTEASLREYKKTGDPLILQAVDGPGPKLTNKFETMYDKKTGQPVQLQEVELANGSKAFMDENGNVRSGFEFGGDPSQVRGTKEYRTRIKQSAGNIKDQLTEMREQFDEYGTGDKKGSKTDILPTTNANKIAEWAIDNGVSPDQLGGLIESAYHDALNDQRQDGSRARDLTPYLQQLVIRQQVGGNADAFKAKGGRGYVNPAKLQTLNAAAANVLKGMGKQGGVNDLSNIFYTEALKDWNALDPDLRASWNGKAQKDESGFYLFAQNMILGGM